MNFVSNCCNCGKIIDREFLYCPWCGIENADVDDKIVLENVFRQLEIKQGHDRERRFLAIQTKILQLENELDSFCGKMTEV